MTDLKIIANYFFTRFAFSVILLPMKEKPDKSSVKLNPENAHRIGRLVGRAPTVFTVNKVANLILSLSLHKFEKDETIIFKFNPNLK